MENINTEKDEKWMRYALDLAKNGMGHVSPNPMVGAVIVRDDEVIGEGWHQYCGGLHAERNALKDCHEKGNDPEGATIYVTLEPCCHYGKTPPCTEAIMENKLGRVVFGAWDPNPLVAGKGIEILRNAGIEADGPVLEVECLKINEIFFHYITTGMPYVISKYAMTADGKIASYTGDSKWITGPKAREHTHMTRKKVSAIMVGIGTVISDDPMLNCRVDDDPVDPIRIICDSNLRISPKSQIVQSADVIRTIVVCTDDSAEINLDKNNRLMMMEKHERARILEDSDVEILRVTPDEYGHVDMAGLMKKLGEMKIDSILLEGGSELHFSALKAGVISKMQVYIAPKIIGGADAKSPVGGSGIDKMKDCIMLENPVITALGQDILIEYSVGEKGVVRCSQE